MKRRYASNRIKQLRIERGLTLEALGGAMASGVTASTVAKLENGHMALSLDYINELARALRVNPLEIICEEGDSTCLRMVPEVIQIAGANWRDAVAMSRRSIAIPAHLDGANLFAVRIQHSGIGSDKYVVIDPDDRELRNGKIYAILDDGQKIALKQFQTDPLRLLSCDLLLDDDDNAGQAPISLGSSPFTVIGRAVYVFVGGDL